MSKFLHGTGAVRDMVLYLAAQFGKGLVVAFRLEDRIVAEALSSPTLTYDGTVDDAFKTHPLSLPRGGIIPTLNPSRREGVFLESYQTSLPSGGIEGGLLVQSPYGSGLCDSPHLPVCGAVLPYWLLSRG